MRKDNRKVLSPSDLTRGSRLNNKANWFDVDSRVKPENDVIKRLPENDSGGNENGCGWKRRGGAAVAVMSVCLVVCMGASEALAQCAVPPTCESLGYNKTAAQCGGTEILKCPFDTSKVFCNSNYVVNAKVGDIYYSDGTISTLVIPDKTPIGIVAYVNGKSGLIISLEESKVKWSSPSHSHLDCVTYLDNAMTAITDVNGKNNTACAILEKKSGNIYPAAEFCYNYKPVTSGNGSMNWYLPSAGEWKRLSSHSQILGVSMQRLSKIPLSYEYYWTSSRSSLYSAWTMRPSDGAMYQSYTYDRTYKVRCLLAF